MKRTPLIPKSLHKPFSTYSHGIKIDGVSEIIFCAGQVAGDKDGNIVGKGDFWSQGHQVMSNLRDVLAEGGATFSSIVKATIFVVGQENAQPGRDLCGMYFDKDNPPGNTLVVCAGLADPEFDGVGVLTERGVNSVGWLKIFFTMWVAPFGVEPEFALLDQ